ncbi:Multidrug resistance-associated protein 4 [Nymphon striatum]|nr:Multidrug resistance-associated protein 4 [Nymphon striatum]
MHSNFASFFTHANAHNQSVISKLDRNIEQYVFKDSAGKGVYKLDTIEKATSKLVPLRVYKEFLRADGNPILILLISMLLNSIYAFIFVGFDYWIKLWTEAEDQKNDFTIHGNMSESTDHNGFFPNVILQNRRNTLLFLLLISIFLVLFSIPTIMFDMNFCIRAAKNLHDRMFGKLLHAPVKFFNCNPIGEILNRFNKDIGQIDDFIPKGYQLLVHVTRSPVFTHVSVTLDGLSTIRAYGALDRFVKLLHNLQNLNMATNLSTSDIGFFISQLVFIYSSLQSNIKNALDLQSKFISVERVLEYGKIKSEEYEGSAGEDKPSDNWPQNGSISAYNLSLSYDKKNFVLKDICFSIIGGQKVGIVGRTGAGKTSLLNAIFRLEEPTGRLIIDGIDISKIGLHQLRKKLTVIPQEPTLFQNTLRCNLDPFGDYCDANIWQTLESVMHNGKVIELDSPRNLVQNDNSHFYKMIMETESAAPLLIKRAMESEFFETVE